MVGAKKLVKTVLPSRALDLARYCWYQVEVRRRARIEAGEPAWDPPMPPPALRYRVDHTLDPKRFDRVGRASARDIERALAETGRSLERFSSVLDFACGCGRIMRHLVPPGSPPDRFHGSDIDAEAIAWDRAHLSHLARWEVNPASPPTDYSTGEFDLIVCVSLLTHLDEDSQFAWLAEFERILAPDGVILLTFHGPFCHQELSARERQALQKEGILYKQFWTGRMKLDGLPESYQLTYHTPEYVEDRWGRHFEPVRRIPQGINHHQDLMVMRKRNPGNGTFT